jgi:DNA-binding transcriptional MerR regulator/methylmalonyl-CoA mutase cobalamin-binding subunit
MIRIGELARRAGVTSEVLRAWERRYGVLQPKRSAGGFRLYGDDDLALITRMRSLIDEGMGPAEAARAVRDARGAAAPAERPLPVALVEALERALLALDSTTAHDAIDALLGAVTVETFLRDAALPILRRIGDRWEAGEITVAHEHFVTNLVRGRLFGLAHGWDRGRGSSALLACAPDELHDIGLIAFGLALARTGWRILYLGQNTPVDALSSVAASEAVDLVVVSAVDPTRFAGAAAALRSLGRRMPLAVGGAGATAAAAKRIHARLLPNDPIAAAHEAAAWKLR